MKKWLKSEKASMTVYVVVAVFSFMIILTSVFLAASAVRKNQLQTIPKIKEAYEQDLNNIQEIYDDREEQEGYIKDGLILHLDAINNTGSGHSNTTTTWKDLSGNGYDFQLSNFSGSINSGWSEDALNFDGINDFGTITSTSLQEKLRGPVTIVLRTYSKNSNNYKGFYGYHAGNQTFVDGILAQYERWNCKIRI